MRRFFKCRLDIGIKIMHEVRIRLARLLPQSSKMGFVYFTLATLLLLLSVRSQLSMLNYGLWQDELETMVVCKMMAAGLTLYKDIFDQHGPLVFAFGWALESISGGTIADYRILIVCLQWLMFVAMVSSYSYEYTIHIFLGFVIVMFWTICVLPQVFGQMFMYQTIAGLFIAIALSISILPNLQGYPTSTWRNVVAGTLLGSLPFLAFTYTAAAIGLLLCSANRSNWRPLCLGVGLAASFNIIVILTLCSLNGFIVDHLYLNIVIYPHYGKNSLSDIWGNTSPLLLICLMIGLVVVCTSTYMLVRNYRLALWRGAAFVICLISLLGRGPHFQAIPFYYAALPLMVALTSWLPAPTPLIKSTILGVIVLCTLKTSLLLPSDIRRIDAGQIPLRSTFSDLVVRYTQPTDRIISYSFDNLEYLLSRRLPAAADFFLLPHQVVYNDQPVLGIRYDPCKDIAVYRPKFVKLDKWTAWDRFPWESYGACVNDIMQTSYSQIKGTAIYVRNDLWPILREHETRLIQEPLLDH